jgi:type II secretory pathway pseudopilin PulG
MTLVDVLVTLAVVAVLIGLMTPALGPIRETARRIACQSNERQMGIALLLYAESYNDHLPPSIFVPAPNASATTAPGFNTARPWETMALRAQSATATDWDGLGLLFSESILSSPEVFYCPSHTGEHRFERYATAWVDDTDDTIFGNYQYRAQFGLGYRLPRLSRLHASVALASDGLRTQSDVNHKGGVNILRADMSVSWFADTAGTLTENLPETVDDRGGPSSEDFEDVWETLDTEVGSRRR